MQSAGPPALAVIALRAVLIAVAAGPLYGCTATASDDATTCRLLPVDVQPRDGAATGRYSGRVGDIDVEFRSERTSGPVDAFPEPPVVVRNVREGHECRIEDGGVWSRGRVYLAAHGRTLALGEHSGSGETLVFYATRDCARVAALELDGARWSVRDTGIVAGRSCTGDAVEDCARRALTRLNAECLPGR